jgi:C4-dicarboxylate-specific signal transduction histidine kinase
MWISKDNLFKIFDSFFTTKLGQSGSGLGLHISYHTISGVPGGTIAVQAVIGGGTDSLIKRPLIAPTHA